MSRSGHACGKAILLGEHAVVYGVPAIAVGIDRGAWAVAVPAESRACKLHVRGWNVVVQETDEGHDLARAFRALLEVTRQTIPQLPALAVEVEAHLPPGGGLGCSAAMGVAIARALDPAGAEADIQERAMAWERVFHGNPSGIDSAVAARGGCLFYTRGSGLEPVRVKGTLRFCIGSTGRPSSTKTMVEAVARLRAKRPDVAEKFEAIGVLVQRARLAIEAGDRVAIGRLMDTNQVLLAGLFVSTAEIERMCGLARDAGAFGAKLTGAGGGGSVVALVSSESVGEAVLAAWRAAGFDGFSASVASETRAQPIEVERAP